GAEDIGLGAEDIGLGAEENGFHTLSPMSSAQRLQPNVFSPTSSAQRLQPRFRTRNPMVLPHRHFYSGGGNHRWHWYRECNDCTRLGSADHRFARASGWVG
ncbi:MAG TPA: hypothetical protein PKZ53_24300, partial [Acidobacteriota bacterium]|nr:hypothetical protein [Acidobacteriota bacterium]